MLLNNAVTYRFDGKAWQSFICYANCFDGKGKKTFETAYKVNPKHLTEAELKFFLEDTQKNLIPPEVQETFFIKGIEPLIYSIEIDLTKATVRDMLALAMHYRLPREFPAIAKAYVHWRKAGMTANQAYFLGNLEYCGNTNHTLFALECIQLTHSVIPEEILMQMKDHNFTKLWSTIRAKDTRPYILQSIRPSIWKWFAFITDEKKRVNLEHWYGSPIGQIKIINDARYIADSAGIRAITQELADIWNGVSNAESRRYWGKVGVSNPQHPKPVEGNPLFADEPDGDGDIAEEFQA